MKEVFTFVSGSHLILIEDDKILLQRRCKTGYEDGKYGLPSGHLDGGETVREGCAREMREELGITILPTSLDIVHVMHRKKTKSERIDFFLTTESYEGAIENREPEKCDDLRWFQLNGLPDNIIEYMRAGIEGYGKGVSYSEYGW